MGAGGGEVEAAAAAAAGGGGVENPHLVALLAEANWVKPFKCDFGSCKEYLPNGASLAYVNSHRAMHCKLRAKENEKEAEKAADRAVKTLAAGPSALKRQNRGKDTAPDQRSGAKAGKGKKGSKGSKAKGKGPAAAGGRASCLRRPRQVTSEEQRLLLIV